MESAIDLTDADSGSLNKPVRIVGSPDARVVFYGGRYLSPEQFKAVQDTSMLLRLLPEVRYKVLQIDLKQQGIMDFGQLKQHGFGRVPGPAPLELYINEERQPLARYPNQAGLKIGRVIDPGSIPRNGDLSGRGAVFGYEYARPDRWLKAKDIWLHGHFSFGFNDDHLQVAQIDTSEKTIAVVQPHLYGLKSSLYVDTSKWIEVSGLSMRQYYAYNLLEEIDEPGEWYLDRQSGNLYLYPPPDFEQAQVEISLLEQPFIRMVNTAHIEIENIRFTTARGMGIYLENAHHIIIDSCRFSNLGTVAISTGQPLLGSKPTYRLDGARLLDDWQSQAFDEVAGKVGFCGPVVVVMVCMGLVQMVGRYKFRDFSMRKLGGLSIQTNLYFMFITVGCPMSKNFVQYSNGYNQLAILPDMGRVCAIWWRNGTPISYVRLLVFGSGKSRR